MTTNSGGTRPLHTIAGFLSDRTATTAIEYAMIAAGISIVILTAVSNIGSAIKTNFYDRLVALMP